MKSHVLLINPSFVFSDIKKMKHLKYNDFPLNIALLASILIEKGYTSEIINANIHEDWEDRIFNSLKTHQIAYVGFTCMSSQVEPAMKISRQIKKLYPDLLIVFGGVHPTLLPESLIRTKIVDICVTGEGDTVIEKLVHYANGSLELESIPNIVAYRRDGTFLKTPKAPLTRFDALPAMMNPALYKNDIERYVLSFVQQKRAYRGFQILTGLGCSYQCAFCINHITKRRYRSKSAHTIYEEMRYLRQNFNINFFVFQEEHFFGDRPRLFELLELIEKDPLLYQNIQWTSTVRVTDIKDSYLDVPLLKRIKNSGCIGLGTGGESGNGKILKTLRKGSKPEDIVRAAQYCNLAQLQLSYSFVMLWPTETVADMLDTADMISLLLHMGRYSHIPYFQTYRPYPGSVWEPDLSRFENPEDIPRDVWRMQLVDRSRLVNFDDPDFVYNLITTTQILCLTAPPPSDQSDMTLTWLLRNPMYPVHWVVRTVLFWLTSVRIRRRWFFLQFERPIFNVILQRYSQF